MNANSLRNSVFQEEYSNFVQPDRTSYAFNPQAVRGARVRVQTQNSNWVEALKGKLDDLASLPNGWDGYRGIPVKFSCAQFAASLIERLCDPSLPPPSLVPGSDGTLQIEWHRNQYDIEIDVLAPLQVVASRYDCSTGKSEEIELETDFTELAAWITELKSDRQLVRVE